MTSVRGMDGSQPRRGSARLIHSDVTRVILGAFYSVHSQLGYGFLEAVYKNAMALMLRRAGLVVDREVDYDVVFHGEVIGRYRADMIVERKVMVEVKAARAIDSAHGAQTLNYLRASGLHVGLLLNFGRKAEFRRIVSPTAPPSSR